MSSDTIFGEFTAADIAGNQVYSKQDQTTNKNATLLNVVFDCDKFWNWCFFSGNFFWLVSAENLQNLSYGTIIGTYFRDMYFMHLKFLKYMYSIC